MNVNVHQEHGKHEERRPNLALLKKNAKWHFKRRREEIRFVGIDRTLSFSETSQTEPFIHSLSETSAKLPKELTLKNLCLGKI